MTLRQDIQKLSAGTKVFMFEIDIRPITGTDLPSDRFYYHPGVSQGSTALIWKGITYQPYPIEIDGMEKNTRGALPRPTLRVANVGGIMSAVAIATDDLVGAKVWIRSTYAKYLDGEPTADPSQEFPEQMYLVERKIIETNESVELELVSPTDFQGFQIPARRLSPRCTAIYRSPECSYAGTNYYDVDDQPVATLAEDVCSLNPSGCKVRFGANADLPFGGFSAVKVYKT